MKTKIDSNVVNIPQKLTGGKELVILPRDEYERLVQRNQEIVEVLRIIAEGEKAYREGKTIATSSLDEALKIYAKSKN